MDRFGKDKQVMCKLIYIGVFNDSVSADLKNNKR